MQWKAYVNVGTKNRQGGNWLVMFLTKSYKVQNDATGGLVHERGFCGTIREKES